MAHCTRVDVTESSQAPAMNDDGLATALASAAALELISTLAECSNVKATMRDSPG